jgi:hypothetical protein
MANVLRSVELTDSEVYWCGIINNPMLLQTKPSCHASGVTPRYGRAARLGRAFEEAPIREPISRPKQEASYLKEAGT